MPVCAIGKEIPGVRYLYRDWLLESGEELRDSLSSAACRMEDHLSVCKNRLKPIHFSIY